MITMDYKTAGVNVTAGNEAVSRIKQAVESTFSAQVLTEIGAFGAMYDLKTIINQYEHPVLVQSIDGVGTKMMVAKQMQKYDTIGIDLVSATTNDILVLGAKPLTLLDYIANDRLEPQIIENIVRGIVTACKEEGISLVGGETAEMPGTYCSGEHDLVGVVTGIVDKNKAITGQTICPGDVVAALPSSGLHTNGYSLARKLLFERGGFQVDSLFPGFHHTIGEELLIPHRNYTKPILTALEKAITIKGMAHITGGGLLGNIPRILPKHCAVEINLPSIPKLPIFSLLQTLGHLNLEQAYSTFNMGVGLVLILTEDMLAPLRTVLSAFPEYPLYEIGRVVAGKPEVTLL